MDRSSASNHSRLRSRRLPFIFLLAAIEFLRLVGTTLSPLPLHRHLGLQARDITVDRRDGERPSARLVAHDAILGRDIAIHRDLVPLFGVADIVDRNVVVLAPEERYRLELLVMAEHVQRRDLALAL